MNINFAQNFKKLRKEKGITQERIAEELGVSGQSVSRWELGICYPDFELLPPIANYFGVTIDTLLSNDKDAREKDRDYFIETVDTLPLDETRIEFVCGYCRKYPDDDFYTYNLLVSIAYYINGDSEKSKKYMPTLLKNAQKLLETKYRSATIQFMSAVCDESELKNWLDMAPYSGFSRRYCLNNRAMWKYDDKGSHIQNGLEMFEHFADLLDRRCPDGMGAERKSVFQQAVMRTVRSFGNGKVPDGWKMFYAYKQLVYSACLFGRGETDKGWENFDSAIEICKYVSSVEDEWLDIGGTLFSGLKVDKPWCYAIDEDNVKHKLFAVHNKSFSNLSIIYDLLTDPRWAWFDSVRDTPKYKEVILWVKSATEEQNSDIPTLSE